jgi:hypothetical protein
VAQALHAKSFNVFGIEASFDDHGNMEGPLGEPALWRWQDRRPVPMSSDPAVAAKSRPGPPEAPGGGIN